MKIRHFRSMRIRMRIRIQGFDDQIWKMFTAEKIQYFDIKIAINFFIGLHIWTSKLQEGSLFLINENTALEISTLWVFSILLVICPPGSGSSPPKSMRIRNNGIIGTVPWYRTYVYIKNIIGNLRYRTQQKGPPVATQSFTWCIQNQSEKSK